MPDLHKLVSKYLGNGPLVLCTLVLLVVLESCSKDYPATIGYTIPAKPVSTSACSCSTTAPTTSTTATQPTSGTTTPVSSTTASQTGQQPGVDTLAVVPPQFVPNGGKLYFNTTVRLTTTDTLPAQAVYEYSFDNGQSWLAGQQFKAITGGTILTRFRVGTKTSRIRSASFTLYFQRMMVIGNSIMNHDPAPSLGWFNANGMAASAPEKDFVHLLTASLQALNPAVTVKLQVGVNFERQFWQSTYSIDEFSQPLQDFKPDLVIIRLGENVADGDVVPRNFDAQFRQLIERVAGYGQPVKIVTTTSVWNQPQTDAVIRRVITEKGYPLVDLSCMVGQGQYFASQYADPGVAAHPNDTGMAKIAELIWAKVQ